MAIREIEVDTKTLQRDIDNLNRLIEKIKVQKKRLMDSVQQMNATWTGPANAVFNAQFANDMISFDNMITVLSDMSKSMKKARKEYDQCENRVDGIIRL